MQKVSIARTGQSITTVAKNGRKDDSNYLICMTYCENDYDLGYYATEENTLKILSEIADAVHIGKSIYYMPEEDTE